MRVLFVTHLVLLGPLVVDSGVVDSCADVQAASSGDDALCYTNVLWAQSEGINTHAEWYRDYSVDNTSSFADFQCILYLNGGGEVTGDSWKCHYQPCTSTLTQCIIPVTAAPSEEPEKVEEAEEAGPTTTGPTTTGTTPGTTSAGTTTVVSTPQPLYVSTNTTTTAAAGSSGSSGSSGSLEWWVWLLLLLAVLLCAAAAYFLLAGGSKKGVSKKKKRAVKPLAAPAPAQAPTPQAAAAPVYYNAIPVTTAQAQYTAAPMYQPVTTAYAAPVQATYTGVPTYMPVQTAAQPMQYYQQ